MSNQNKIKEYVIDNYPKRFKNKQININEGENCYFVTSGKDESPIILSKNVGN
jgi:hypothetical protein|tara:strand:- start:97 stop:255 length:159 start_codon:yes stop_codon:yes gene_type:complete